MATPIGISGHHVANVFIWQVFFSYVQISISVPFDNAKLCRENDALGAQANPYIASLCSERNRKGSTARPRAETKICKPIPSRSKINFEDLPLSALLTNGVQNMNKQFQDSFSIGKSEAIFVLGNTGSGKTTATQIMAGNLYQMHSTKTEDGTAVIIDDNQKIGAPTTKSRTLIPEYVRHPESGVAFWDCSGFDDNRGPEIDIAAMYFVKHAMDTTKSAKFVFTVSHNSVKLGGDRNDFDLLATHAVRLLKNINKFKESIGLIVTKVGGYSQQNGAYLRDDDILKSIREFFAGYIITKNDELEKSREENMRHEVQGKIDFVNSILGHCGSNGSGRIYFIRSPVDCGVLGDMESILQTRKKLTEMYSDHLQYIEVTPNDFHFTLKDATALKVHQDFIPNVTKLIGATAEVIALDIKKQLIDKFHNNIETGTEEGFNYLGTSSAVLHHFCNAATNKNASFNKFVSLQDMFSQLYTTLNFTQNNCTNIFEQTSLESQLRFYKKITNNNESLAYEFDQSWVFPVCVLKNDTDKLVEFYEFYNSTESELQEYSNQVKISVLGSEDIIFEDNNAIIFLQDTKLIPVSTRIVSIWHILPVEDKHIFANMIRQLVPKLEMKCSKSRVDSVKYRLTVSGRNLRLSDVMEKAKWPGSCRNEDVVRELSVVALERLFLDVDIIALGKQLQVSMIAPILQTVLLRKETERKINLDGIDAPKTSTSLRGKHGLSGEPGGDAGTFMGIFKHVTGGENLRISADGGNGGDGQNGQNGQDGSRGEDASKNYYSMDMRNAKYGWVFKNNEWRKSTRSKTGSHAVCDWCTKFGGIGQKGADGGDGGDSGAPGNAGTVHLVSIGHSVENLKFGIVTSSKSDKVGRAGAGGLGGLGGMYGNAHTCFHGMNEWWRDCHNVTNTTRAASGTKGRDGKVTQNTRSPTPIVKPWQTVIEYKISFGTTFSKLNFMKELDSNSQILQLIKPISFIVELQNMESFYYELSWNSENQKRSTFLSFYEDVLKRLHHYSKFKTSVGERPNEDMYALNIIYAEVLSKLNGMRRAEQSMSVVKTMEYFDTVVQNVKNLEKAQNQKLVQEQSDRFQSKLQDKVIEATNFIQNTVKPAIKEAESTIQDMNDKLLQETNDFLREAEANVDKEKELKQQFEKYLPLKQFLGVLNIVGTAVQFCGPIGMATGGILSTGTSMAQSFMTYPNPSNRKRGSVVMPPQITKMLEDENKAYHVEKIENTEKLVGYILETEKQLLAQNIALVTGLDEKTKMLQESIKNLKEASGRKADPLEVYQLELQLGAAKSELEQAIIKKDKQLEAEAAASTTAKVKVEAVQEKEKILAAAIKKLAVATKVADAVTGLVLAHLESGDELARMDNIIKDAQEKVKGWKKRKDEFYSNFLPALQSISDGLHNENSELSGQSQVGLTVKRWKMKRLLKNMMWYVQQYTKEFKVAEEFQVCVDRLNEAFTLLIDLYEQIERYEEKKALADFIANVNSADENDIEISDMELKSALKQLKFSIRANLLIEEYQKAMHAFKQWVFPFASHYLENSNISSAGTIDPSNFTSAVNIYKSQVESLRLELGKYQAMTVTRDAFLKFTTFSSDLESSEPFYVWTREMWSESIKKLLSGRKIYLKADVNMIGQKSAAFFKKKSAVKFKTVEVAFKTHNASLQLELDTTLKHFEMEMTHSGISVYKVLEQQYVMRDRNLTYTYSFERTAKGHVSRNGVKYKVEGPNADFLMSPYTWWTFQLINVKPGNGFDFPQLQAFAHEVDMELEGEGVYFDEARADRYTLKALELADYYEEYKDESVISGYEYCRKSEDQCQAAGEAI